MGIILLSHNYDDPRGHEELQITTSKPYEPKCSWSAHVIHILFSYEIIVGFRHGIQRGRYAYILKYI